MITDERTPKLAHKTKPKAFEVEVPSKGFLEGIFSGSTRGLGLGFRV